MSKTYGLYFLFSLLLFNVVCILLIHDIHKLLYTVILYLCLLVIDITFTIATREFLKE